MRKSKIQNLTLIALMAAILCIVGPVMIPIGMVPMSITNMAIYLSIILLDKKKATIGVVVYLMMGFIGLPIYSGFTGGAGKLLGPTGGYLIGYLVLSWISGKLLEILDKANGMKQNSKQIMALGIGTIGLYFVGTIWLMIQSKLTLFTALSVGVFPFVVFDMIKIVVAVYLGNEVKKRLQSII